MLRSPSRRPAPRVAISTSSLPGLLAGDQAGADVDAHRAAGAPAGHVLRAPGCRRRRGRVAHGLLVAAADVERAAGAGANICAPPTSTACRRERVAPSAVTSCEQLRARPCRRTCRAPSRPCRATRAARRARARRPARPGRAGRAPMHEPSPSADEDVGLRGVRRRSRPCGHQSAIAPPASVTGGVLRPPPGRARPSRRADAVGARDEQERRTCTRRPRRASPSRAAARGRCRPP